jgi:hypothetical protein
VINAAWAERLSPFRQFWPREAARSLHGIGPKRRRTQAHASREFSVSDAEGYFIDWDGNARSTRDPGGGYLCETDLAARYVAITAKSGALVHEATLYKSLEDVAKAGIKAQLVPGSHPWGKREDGF